VTCFPKARADAACLTFLPISLALLRAVDAAEADKLRVGVVQDLDGVAVEDGDNGAGEVIGVWIPGIAESEGKN